MDQAPLVGEGFAVTHGRCLPESQPNNYCITPAVWGVPNASERGTKSAAGSFFLFFGVHCVFVFSKRKRNSLFFAVDRTSKKAQVA